MLCMPVIWERVYFATAAGEIKIHSVQTGDTHTELSKILKKLILMMEQMAFTGWHMIQGSGSCILAAGTPSTAPTLTALGLKRF